MRTVTLAPMARLASVDSHESVERDALPRSRTRRVRIFAACLGLVLTVALAAAGLLVTRVFDDRAVVHASAAALCASGAPPGSRARHTVLTDARRAALAFVNADARDDVWRFQAPHTQVALCTAGAAQWYSDGGNTTPVPRSPTASP